MRISKNEKIRQQQKVIMEQEHEIARLKIYQFIVEDLKKWLYEAPQMYNNIDIKSLLLVKAILKDKIDGCLKRTGVDKQ